MAVQIPQYLQEKLATARQDRQLISDIFPSVVRGMADLAVSPAGGLSVSCAVGTAYVPGTQSSEQGRYRVRNESAAVTLTHDAAVTNPRLDQVVARVQDSAESGGAGPDIGTLEIVKGTEAAGATLDNRSGATPDGSLPANVLRLADVLVATAGTISIRDRRPKNKGTLTVAGEESRTNTAYGLLATADQINDLVVPAGGRLLVSYRANWKNSVSGAGRAAIFLGSNQLKTAVGGAAPVAQEAGGIASADVFNALGTSGTGLTTHDTGTAYTGDVTTGQVDGMTATAGGLLSVLLAAGTYHVGVQFKASSGSVTAKNRSLSVFVLAP